MTGQFQSRILIQDPDEGAVLQARCILIVREENCVQYDTNYNEGEGKEVEKIILKINLFEIISFEINLCC